MSKGKSQTQWSHTSAVIAKIHNVNCSKQSEMKSAKNFNPHYEDEPSDDVIVVDNPEAIKKMKADFVG